MSLRIESLSLVAIVALTSSGTTSCSSRTSAAGAAKEAGADPASSSAASASASGSGSASASPAASGSAGVPTAASQGDVVAYLKKSVPASGSVDAQGKIFHTVAAGDTAPSIAAAYLELTEIYSPVDLAKAIEKKNPSLVVGQKIEIPAPLTRAPRDPREEKLGWPEDRALRALFMTGPYARDKWTESLDKMAPRGINAVVLDSKDYMGPVNYPTKAKVAVEINAAAKPSIPNLARMIRFAHWRGIRVVLRIPCFHDPYADKRPKDARLSLKHAQTGQPLHIDWLDPTNTEAQDYAIELTKEGVEAGADEINLDYVRFPVHVTNAYAKMPEPKDRSNVIRDFVKRVHEVTKPAGVMLSLDLFGVTATGTRDDIERLGQDIATVGPEAEVIMPMVYPSHYDKGYNGWEHPGDHPEIVGIGTKGALAQLKKVGSTTVVRAWIQAFPWRTNVFGAKYVVDQAKSAEANGGVGWAMWSPSCEYSSVYSGFPPKDGSKDPPSKK
ncbi:MAG: hypothetical protein JST00_09780 [Deltaproteobacteria bacterium]|nr:hypothetical protein [Deltaproteobacteria bacterium]